jgi:hypothetical protein
VNQHIVPVNLHQPAINLPVDGKLSVWNPILGLEFNRYIATLPPDQAARLNTETPRILSACVSPLQPGMQSRANAGLVLGYVQSGKTSSFTAVTALAKDNNYNCVIIIGGTGTILLDQTVKRLNKDLNLGNVDVVNRWLFSQNPKLNAARPDVDRIQALLAAHSTNVIQGKPQVGPTPLIAVMKDSSHLKNLNAILSGLGNPGLAGISALIIDDECHMSTPDIGRINDPSKIYSLMRELRTYFPNHTLLQYTATPQANLLCTLNDEFRPEFVRLLGTGNHYAGGKRFFVDPPKAQNIRRIPILEQQSALAAHKEDPPPKTLLIALATYNQIKNQNNYKQFSMLVHSNSTLAMHKVFNDWLSSLRTTWLGVLDRPDNDRDKTQLINEIFKPAYDDIKLTANTPLNSLVDLIGSPIKNVLSGLIIWLVDGNKKAGGVRDPIFNLSNYNIINGGDMLGVGFTIPQLTVTHMLRSEGQGQLDTVQQRGRFFGYCADRYDRIRVWLSEEVQNLFAKYVNHEETLRQSFTKYDQENLDLKNWKLKFRMDKSAKACRRGAIKLAVKRFSAPGGWVQQKYWSDNSVNKAENLKLVNDFIYGENLFANISPKPKFSIADKSIIGGNPETHHHQASYHVEELYKLLSDFKFDSRDEDEFDILRETISEFVEDNNFQTVDVIHIAKGYSPARRRRKITNDKVDLQQGRNAGYAGDSSAHSTNITVQIHFLDHGDSDKNISEENVVYLAVWLPTEVKEWAEGWILQNE